MEDCVDKVKSPTRKAIKDVKDEIGETSTEGILSNGTDGLTSSDLSEEDTLHSKAQSVLITKVTKSVKTEQSKDRTKSPRKEVKSPKKSCDSPASSETSQESFHGFDESSSLIKQESEKNKKFSNFIEHLRDEEGASTSCEESGNVGDSEGVVESGDNQDISHVSETDSDCMEIDMGTDSSEQNKDLDVDVGESSSVNSGGSKMKRMKKENVAKTDTPEEPDIKAPILEASLTGAKIEYCGSCEKEVDDAEEGICCDGKCERWFHLSCSGLSRAEYDELSTDANANWACSKCSGKPPPPPASEVVKPLINVRKDLTQTPSPTVSTKRKSTVKETKNPKVDISNPAYLKPFDYGWKRELVFRSTNESTPSAKRQGDIYYYTPKGKKLRSLREISEHIIGTELTMDNFTFFKDALGVDDPEKEIIRDAKFKTANKDSTPSPATPKSIPKITKAVKTTPKLTATVTPLDSSGSSATTPKASASVMPRVVLKKSQPSGGIKVKFPPPSKTTSSPAQKLAVTKDRKKKAANDDLEMGMLPPMWGEPLQKPKDTKGESSKRPLESPSKEAPAAKKPKTEIGTVVAPPPATPFNFLQNINYMYTALLQAFQYLKVQELLRASRVCHLWHDVALHKDLWSTVRMKNSQVKDWEGFAATLKHVGTRNLDLRKILMPDKPEALKAMLTDCAKALSKINSLVKLDLCRCTSSFLESIAASCTQLEYISACAITKSGHVNLTNLGKCQNLTELRLKSQGGMELTNIEAIEHLSKLKHVSLTTVKNMNEVLVVLGRMPQLESLELGDLTNITEAGVKNFSHLKKLRRLRLEKGQQDCPTEKVLQTISQLSSLTQLELINFDVKVGFEEALGLCSNIKILLIIPTYVTQSATTNHLVIEGVSKLSKTLTHFVWGLTTELLRVTDLFIDQWEMQRSPEAKNASQKKTTNDSIPILKPSTGKDKKDGAVTQVDVLQLPKLHKVLLALLPNTKIIILKVPFCHTWRQTISGSVP